MNKNIIISTVSIMIGVGCLVASTFAANTTSQKSQRGTPPCGNMGSGEFTTPPEGFGSGNVGPRDGSGGLARHMMESGSLDHPSFDGNMTPPEGTSSGEIFNKNEKGSGSGMMIPCQNTNTESTSQNTISTNTKKTPSNTKLQSIKDRLAKLKAERLAKQKQTTSSTSVE